ncbi:MAG: hypothetical protein K6C36_01130 [Clostridia bacterium]|nr:hypothetical protein [Clostridia bacterium]
MEVFPEDFAVFFDGKANFQLPLETVVKIFTDIVKLIKSILNALGIIKDEDMDPSDIF